MYHRIYAGIIVDADADELAASHIPVTLFTDNYITTSSRVALNSWLRFHTYIYSGFSERRRYMNIQDYPLIYNLSELWSISRRGMGS